MEILELLFITAFGAIFGSYATLFAYRLPLEESCFGRYFGPKSRCPQCDTIIRTRELIPLLNWLFTLGRCRKCKVKVPRIHLFVELTTTSLFLICYLTFGISENFILYSLICTGLVILTACDYTHTKFPTPALNFILMIGLVIRVLQDGTAIDAIFSASIGIILAIIFYQIFYKRTNKIFASESQSFDYTKFILIASVCLPLHLFFIFYLSIIFAFSTLFFLNIAQKTQRNNFGYALTIPLAYLLLYPSIII